MQNVPKYHIVLRDKNCNTNLLMKKINKLIESTLGKSNVARYYEFYNEPLPRTASGKLDPKPLQEKDTKIKKLTRDLKNEENFWEHIETEHEKMFSEQGIKIKALICQKCEKL